MMTEKYKYRYFTQFKVKIDIDGLREEKHRQNPGKLQ